MATLYFNGADDIANSVPTDWNNLDNWWTDSGLSVQATSLPSAADSVIILEDVDSNSGSEPTVVNMTVDGKNLQEFSIDITVTGLATFGGTYSEVGFAPNKTLTGNAIFINSYNYGTIDGNASFDTTSIYSSNANLVSDSIVTGNATFDGYSIAAGSVLGHVVFNDQSSISNTLNQMSNAQSYTFNDYTVLSDIYLDGKSVPVTLNDYAVADTTDTDLHFGGGTITFNDFASVSDSDLPRLEGSTLPASANSSAIFIFNDDSMYWVNPNIVDRGTWTFKDRAINNSMTSGEKIATFLPNRGINGSSILGIL